MFRFARKYSPTHAAVALFPICSVFAFGRLFEMPKNDVRAAFQPPGWVFGVVWTYLTLALGCVSAQALKTVASKNARRVIWSMYSAIMFGLLAWLPLFSKTNYRACFWLLVATTYASISYVWYLGYCRVRPLVAAALLPLPFWLVLACCLNGVTYNNMRETIRIK